MPIGLSIGLIAAALALGAVVGFLVRRLIAEKKIGSAEEQARKLLEDAIRNAESAKKEAIISAKDEIFKMQKEAGILPLNISLTRKWLNVDI